MNERIKELAIEAGIISAEYNGFDPTGLTTSQRKFAELIIKECSEVILKWKKEPFPFDEDTAVSIIHEHFGIELPPKTIRVIKI
jgi:hypothetical protein